MLTHFYYITAPFPTLPPPPPPRKNPKTSEIFLRYMYIWTHDDFDHTLNLKDKSIISLYTKVHLVMLVSRFRTKCLGYTHSPNIILLCMSRGCLLQCKKKTRLGYYEEFFYKRFYWFFFLTIWCEIKNKTKHVHYITADVIMLMCLLRLVKIGLLSDDLW